VLTLVGQPGSIFCAQEPLQCSQDGADKGSEKKAAKRLLQHAAEQHVLDLIDVLVCDALYADADCIATVQSYGIRPVIRIKQEQDNIMKEVDELDTVVKILGHTNPLRAWWNASVVCSRPSALDSRIMSRAMRPSQQMLLRTRYTLFCLWR